MTPFWFLASLFPSSSTFPVPRQYGGIAGNGEDQEMSFAELACRAFRRFSWFICQNEEGGVVEGDYESNILECTLYVICM